ncbi:hypothetical protein Q5P01_014814 [Channa striata]|uniref:Taste receptor type 2 n=1 Tax=Channa striata TaxID=64152 RepID=A0AA88MJB1_CHASR|nr:hypothetical protein Q5P01_014814 [Channa striata]
MFALWKFTIWIITGLLAVTSVFFNVYMFSMSLLSFKQKKLCPTDTIIVALSAADVAHQLLCYFWLTMDVLDSTCLIFQRTYTGMLLLIFSLKFTIMWDSSLLTFYYSTKLVSTHNHCYSHIQAAIVKHVTLAVCVIPLCGLGTSVPMSVVFNSVNQTDVNKNCEVLTPGRVYVAIYVLLSDILPGLLMAKCCISISIHLIIHLRQMKASTNGAHCPRLGCQMRVVQMALSLVAIFTISLVVDLYVHYQIAVNHKNVIVFMYLFTSVYTTVTAVVLIYGKKTLWKALIHDFNLCLD